MHGINSLNKKRWEAPWGLSPCLIRERQELQNMKFASLFVLNFPAPEEWVMCTPVTNKQSSVVTHTEQDILLFVLVYGAGGWKKMFTNARQAFGILHHVMTSAWLCSVCDTAYSFSYSRETLYTVIELNIHLWDSTSITLYSHHTNIWLWKLNLKEIHAWVNMIDLTQMV